MRVLIVAAAPAAGSPELVSKLAAVHDSIIAVDGGGAVCVEAGVRPDVVLGDFDSIDPAALDWLRRGGSRINSFPADKDQTDLELALSAARSQGADRVTVTAVSGRRLDHTLAAIGAIGAAADLWPEVVEPQMRAWVVSAEARDSLRVTGVGATISLVSWGAGARLSISGVRWPLEQHDLPFGSGLGVSNVVTDEAGALIRVHAGTIFAIAPDTFDAVRAQAD